MAFMRNINDFILTLVALSLPSIAATIDCNGKPFHCLNSTHFMICVDFGSGVSSTMDDFVIPCPPTTVCQATNRFECEFPTVTTTTATSVVTNSPLAATVSNDVVIDNDTVSDVTTIPFEDYFNTISTTTFSEGSFITRDVGTKELPVNNQSKSEVNVAATDPNINETAIAVGVSPNYFTTLATLDIVTDEATVTERIPNYAENVNVNFETNSNIDGTLLDKIEIIQTDIDNTNLSENNTVDVTENYESNSTLLETIIGATNFRQFHTSLYNSTSYNVTEPILSEATESIISIPIDDKPVYLTTLDASPDMILDDKTIENVTESAPANTAEYKDFIQFQSDSTLNVTMSTVDIVQNNPTTFDSALDTNEFALNINNSDLSFNEITTKYEEQISTAEPIIFKAKENTINIPVDVFLDDQTRDNATESIPTATTEYKHLIQSQSNRFNNKPFYNSSSYDVTEPILSEVTESIINIPIDDKHVYLTTLDASPGVVLHDKTIENVTESIPTNTTEYEDLIQSQKDSTLNETMSTADIVQNDSTILDTAPTTNGFALNVNNSNLFFTEITTKYEEQVRTEESVLYEAKDNSTNIPVDMFLDNATVSIPAATTEYKHLIQSQSNRLKNKTFYNSASYNATKPILSEATESIISVPIDDKPVYLTTLDASPDMVLDDKTIENVTESIPTNTTDNKDIIQSQSNSTLNETMATVDIVKNYLNTLDTNGFALIFNNSDLSFNEITTKYEEQINTEEPVLYEAKENSTNIPVDMFLDNATVSIPAATTEYNHFIQSQSNRFNNKTFYNSASYNATKPILSEATESIISVPIDDKPVYLTTLDASPDLVLDDKTIENVTESIPTKTTDYKDLIQSQSNSTLNETMSTDDIIRNDPTTLTTALNTNASDVYSSNLYLNENTTPYYKEKISTAPNNSELSGSTSSEITQPGAEMENITKRNLSVLTINTTTGNTEPKSTKTQNAAINTGDSGELTVQLNVIQSGNKNNISTTELSLNISKDDSVTSILDNTFVKPKNNINTMQSENFRSVYDVENVTKTETKIKEKHWASPEPPSSNETTTIVHGNRSSADNTSTTYRISNIDAITVQNKTILHDNSARTDEAQRVFTSEVNVNDMTAEATKNNHLLQLVTGPTSTPFSDIAHNVVGSDLTNENPQEMTTFINRIELTVKGNVTNETLTKNIISSDMNNSTKITVAPSNQIGLNNSVLTTNDQINWVEISESTPNYIVETATQEVDSSTYNNVYYQTDIEEISHDQGTPRYNLLSADTIESTPSILVMTTESTKEPHFNAVLRATPSFNSVSDKTYTAENENYVTSTTNSLKPEASPTTAHYSIKSVDDTTKPVTKKNEVEKTSKEPSRLEINSALNENSNIRTTDITNSLQQTAITSSTALVNLYSTVNHVKQVTRQIKDEKISTEPSILLISFAVNDTAYVATEKNIPSAEVTPEPGDLIPDQFKYTTITETANDSVDHESRITIPSYFSTTELSESSALSAQNNPDVKETLISTITVNTATDLSAIPTLTVSNLSGAGVTYFREEINGTTVDSPTTKTSVDAISEASTSNVMEKYPIAIEKENINPESTRNIIKTNTTTAETTAKDDTIQTELLRTYSIQSENISKLEITSAVTDQTTVHSFIADKVNYNENQNKPDTHDRLFSNAQLEPNIPEILSDRFGVNIYDPNSSINKATLIDGLTSHNNGVAVDTKLTREKINQKLNNKLVTPKTSTAETLLNESLKGKDVLPVQPELKSNSGSIVKIKTPESKGDIHAYPIITPKTSSFESHTDRKSSFTTSIQESKYQSNLASSTESWRATVVTEPVFLLTRPYIETLITSSKPYTESNDQISQDVTSLTPKFNLANPSEKQYINHPQNMELVTKTVLSSSEPSVIFTQVTEPSSIENQDIQLSSVRKSTSQKSFGIDTLNLVQNQRVSTENQFVNVRPLVSPSTITNPVDLSMKKSFTSVNTQILPEHGEQIEVPTTEKLTITKVNVTPIVSPSVKDNKPLDGTAVPIVKSSNNLSKDVMPNAKTAMYNSNRTVESVSKTEFNKVQLNITTEKTVTQSSDLDIVMVDVIKTASTNLGEIVSGSNNTHSGISAVQKSTSQQVEKRKTIKSEAEYEHETEKEENPQFEEKEKPEVAEINSLSGKIEYLTSTEGIPNKKEANVEHITPLNTKQKPVLNITNRIRPGVSHVENTTARYNTKSKSPVANTHNTTLPSSETTKQNFVCKSNDRGRFSDSEDCRKFYVCIGKQEPIKGICPNNTVFSELRKQCTKNLSHCVRNNQFHCISEGRFSDYLYDNIYYICVNNKANRFIRFKLQCQNGYHLNKTSVRCVLNTESILSTSQQSKSASEVSISNQSVSAKSEQIKEKPKANQKFECKRSGKFPKPDDCRKYYVCTKLGKNEYRQRIKKCDSDELYNRDKKRCVDADSYECS